MENMNKSIKMLNQETDNLEKILTVGKSSGDGHGLGQVSSNPRVSQNRKFQQKPPCEEGRKEGIKGC